MMLKLLLNSSQSVNQSLHAIKWIQTYLQTPEGSKAELV